MTVEDGNKHWNLGLIAEHHVASMASARENLEKSFAKKPKHMWNNNVEHRANKRNCDEGMVCKEVSYEIHQKQQETSQEPMFFIAFPHSAGF